MLVNSMAIYHPYGTVGALPWQQPRQNIVAFGDSDLEPRKLMSLANEIKTFAESSDPQNRDVDRTKRMIGAASILVFLGFRFHRLNMELLGTEPEGAQAEAVSIYATAKGMSDHDVELVEQDLRRIRRSYRTLKVRNDLTCNALFEEYWRSLALT